MTAAGEAVVLETRANYGRTIAVLTLIAVSTAIQQTALTPALPAIQEELGVSTTAVAWLLTVFVLSASIVTPILGRLSDIFGKDRVMLFICACVTLGGLVGGLAHSLPMLIVARALQGVGGSIFAVAFGILRDEAPPERRATGFGLVSSAYGVGGGAGFILSGLVVDRLSYRWLFWLGMILFAIATLAVKRYIAASPMRTPASIDWVGAGLMTAGLSALLLGVSETVRWGWTSGPVLALFGIAAVVLVVWARWELRCREPLVDVRLLSIRGVWTINATSGLVGFGMYSLLILVPKFVQTDRSAGYGFGGSVLQAGLFLMPWTIMMMLAAASAGLLARRFGSRALLFVGSLSAALSFAWLAAFHDERWQIMLATGALGVAIGLSHSSMANLIAQVVPHAQVGEAMGIMSIGRTIGSALGAQVAATVVASSLIVGTGVPRESGYAVAFALASVIAAASCACVLAAPSDHPSIAARRA